MGLVVYRFGKRSYPRYLNFDADDLQPLNV